MKPLTLLHSLCEAFVGGAKRQIRGFHPRLPSHRPYGTLKFRHFAIFRIGKFFNLGLTSGRGSHYGTGTAPERIHLVRALGLESRIYAVPQGRENRLVAGLQRRNVPIYNRLNGIFPLGVWLGVLLFLGSLALTPAQAGNGEGNDEEETTWYISGMHPWIIQPEPGNCPICGMELTPLQPDMLTGELEIDPLITQNIGVRIAPVETGFLQEDVRLVGEIVVDPTLRHQIVLRAEGYLEELYVHYEGQKVEEGELLAKVHSPRVQSAGYELLAALPSGDPARIGSARSRLRILGVGKEDIDAIEETGEVGHTFSLRSPQEGIVTFLDAHTGSWQPEGAFFLEITNLDKLWAEAMAYPNQQKALREGLSVTVRHGEDRERTVTGELDYLYPTENSSTRQRKVRVVLHNGDRQWVPGSWVRLDVQTDPGEETLIAPRMAFLDTGERTLAFVSRGNGRFDPREVRLGRENRFGQVEILEGLSEGENLVVSGQFLLDSEAKIREAIIKMVEGDMAAEQAVEADESGEITIAHLPEGGGEHLARALRAAFAVNHLLVNDTTEGLGAAAREWEAALRELTGASFTGGEKPLDWDDEWKPRLQRAAREAGRLAEESRPRAARIILRDLNDAWLPFVRAAGIPAEMERNVHEVRCPMFPEMGENAYWLQPDVTTANPYMGQAMLTCMDQREAIARRDGEAVAEPEENGDDHDRVDEEETTGPVEPAFAEEDILAMAALVEDWDVELAEADQAFLREMITGYLELAGILVKDETEGKAEPLGAMRDAWDAWVDQGLGGEAHFWHQQDEFVAFVRERLEEMMAVEELDEVRRSLRAFSPSLIALIEHLGSPPEYAGELMAAQCPMYPEMGDNAWWLQKREPLENPYWGDAMLRCADEQKDLP
ncbi:MAG: efflux RND transporter periplasmic adaptor subunit [Opitutales bacterium]|nr:efflux RND transporter periplasmic adaptor subunit [Opitutales bacterium]